MQPTTTTVNLLYVTDGPADSAAVSEQLGLNDDTAWLSVTTSIEGAVDELAEGTVNCVLCARADDRETMETVRTLRGEHPSVPVITLVGDASPEFVDSIIEAGATDAIQSTPEAVPAALLHRRIDSVTEGQVTSDRTFERYETILNAAVDPIYQLDPDGTIVAVNDAAADVTGYERSELIGSDVSLIMTDTDIEEGERLIAQALSSDERSIRSLEMDLQTKDGESIPCETRLAIIETGGEFLGTVGVARDISERKATREQLKTERDAFAQGPAVLFRWRNELGWPVEFVSENVEDVVGYTPDELQSGQMTYDEIVSEEDIDRVTREVEQHSDGTTDRFNHEPYRVVTKAGDVRWVTDTTKIIREDGEITHYLGYLVDITERKQRERDLQALKEEYEMMVETVGDVVYTLDEDYYFTSANGAAEAITGYTCEELEGEHISKLLSEEGVHRGLEERRRLVHDEIDTGTLELDLYRKDGSVCPVEFRFRELPFEAEFRGTAGVIRDVSERKAREQKIQDQRDELAQLDRLNAVIREVDQVLVGASSHDEIERAVCERLTESGHYQFALTVDVDATGRLDAREWTDAAESYVERVMPVENATPENSPGTRALDTGETQIVEDMAAHPKIDIDESDDELPTKVAAIPVTYKGKEYGVVAVYGDQSQAFSDREIEILGELGDTIGYALAAIEQRERGERLTSLYEATRALLGTETEEEVSQVVINVAADALDLPGAGIFLFDDEENLLRPAAATDELLSFYGETTTFGPGRAESEVWHEYLSGEQRYFEDVRVSDHLANPDTDARSALMLPLGDHGVFVAAAAEIDAFDEQKRQLIGLLAATTEAALDRVAGQEDIRERDQKLAERTRTLEQFDRLNSLLRDVTGQVIHASARADIERIVCDRLAEEEEYALAWIGSIPPDESVVEPQTWAGDTGEYLDDATFAVSAQEPGARAATEGEVTVVDNVTDHLRETEWGQPAIEYNYQSVAAVPLVYGDTTYGVLAVYATAPEAFDETTRGVLSDLGELVAYGINVTETKQGILAERVTELELHIETPETFLNAVAEIAGETVQYREITPEGGDTARVLFELSDPSVEAVLELESKFVAVESLSHVERGDRHLFRATLSGETVAAMILECGAIPKTVAASADETQAVVWLPQQLDVREFLERVRESHPETELLSRQDVDPQTESRETVRAALEEELTDRQREVLLTAYESGFFESPRQTTGAELADLLGISQPTVTHHLREAQRRLFAELFDDVD